MSGQSLRQMFCVAIIGLLAVSVARAQTIWFVAASSGQSW
jgi:hypothetical protein